MMFEYLFVILLPIVIGLICLMLIIITDGASVKCPNCGHKDTYQIGFHIKDQDKDLMKCDNCGYEWYM